MSYDNDQTDAPLPAGGKGDRKSVDLLPKYFRTQANKKILSSTIDQLVQPGTAEKINGYMGRKNAKAFKASDTYIADVTQQRQDRQLEPATVSVDDLGNVNFFADYTDYVNQVGNFSGNNENQSRLNSQEYYAWNPNIDWDKFTNFREYYWLPNGPQTVSVFGKSLEEVSTYTVTTEDQGDNVVYKFSPPGFEPNPALTLYRGQTYTFEIDTPGHPFSFSTDRRFADAPFTLEKQDDGSYKVISGSAENVSSLYVQGLTATDLEGNEIDPVNVEKGRITFTVPFEAPEQLYYTSRSDINTSGYVKVFDIIENTQIDVNEIIGKKTYTSSNKVQFTNGLKVKFAGRVTPEKYASDEWYVEGVGSSIRLVREQDLVIPASYVGDKLVPFDSEGFDRLPFGNASAFAETKDYIVINRASVDRNAWTRYNKWFHKDVIEKSAEYNNEIASIDQSGRASRPIIEFNAGLKLFNYGTQAKDDVDLIDYKTTDAFSTIEGGTGYSIDNVNVADGMRVIFNADTDRTVRGKIYKVKFILIDNIRQISLVEDTDATAQVNETVLIKSGDTYKGRLFYFDGTNWNESQRKLKVNQQPLFDVFDESDDSFGTYNASTFSGTELFAYTQGTGTNDAELGFPLSYRAIENFGDIQFKFPLVSDSFVYEENNSNITVNVETGYVRKYTDLTSYVSENGWIKANKPSTQAIVRQYVVDTTLNDFAVDVFDRSGDLNDLVVKVYVNNSFKKESTHYDINRINGVAYITFKTNLKTDDIVLLRCFSKATKTDNGYYELAYNLERNPMNENIGDFTIGEVTDHVSTIIENTFDYDGNKFPGVSNLRDIGNLSQFGTRFVKHTGPIALASYHLTDKNANIVKALKYARLEYAKYKRLFLQVADTLGYDGPIKEHVDNIIAEINSQKTDGMPFYFSDMIPHGASKRTLHIVRASDGIFYPLATKFDLSNLSERAVLVYLNDKALCHGSDYTFTEEGFVKISATLAVNDEIEIYEYDTTDGCFVPTTPTKLGLYPAYKPELYLDTTQETPRNVIQGHDGSISFAYGDYRDDLILDFERRIYNNLKQAYNTDVFDVHEFVGGNFRDTGFKRQDVDSAMVSDFVQWSIIAGDPNYTENNFWKDTQTFRYNYKNMSSPTGKPLPGFWRGVYKDAYDTDRPHTHPWEMLGFTIKPSWWEAEYGPAPYTRNNFVLWEDIEKGLIKEPGKPARVDNRYKRPGLTNHIPADENGNLLSPLDSNYAQNFVAVRTRDSYTFGDHTPTESAWRRSSEYPFALITSWLLNQPAKVLGTGFDLSRMMRNKTGNLVYTPSNTIIRLKDLVFPNTYTDNQRVITSGLVNFIYNYIVSDINTSYNEYQTELKTLKNQLALKVGGFTDKSKFKLILDSRTPLNEGNVFVPEENYKLFLNTSTPVEIANYSGVVVQKNTNGYVIKGYDQATAEFKYFEPIQASSDPVINIGGISESFVNWDSGKQYVKGQNVRFDSFYYRVNSSHVSGSSFDDTKMTKLAELPLVGGRSNVLRRKFTNRVNTIPYGTLLTTTQEVVDFLLGYEAYLKAQGFKFEYYNKDISVVEDWTFSVKEFMFWTTQNWAAGSVLTISPGAQQFKFNRQYMVVDNIFDTFYDYSLLKADGQKLERSFSSIARDTENDFGLSIKNTADGIYSVKLPLVQREHVILLDNKTVFGDVIYDQEAGYRQERIKVTGYRSDNWSGGLNIPGFIYDEAEVRDWTPYKDYGIGKLIKHKEFYYVALANVTGTEVFVDSQWERLENRPQAQLVPNFEYKINQFADFYDLDTDNFDLEQQKHAQHLIGYQKRKYLENIINDDVSQYKFYQGMLQDKGTKNSLVKLFDALASADKESLEFYEEWAIRVGQYGATENFEDVEFLIDEKEIKTNPQPIELVTNLPANDTDTIYKLTPADVYKRPQNYDHKPFPTVIDYKQFTKDAGFVFDSDVAYRINDKTDILTANINVIGAKDYVWVTGDQQPWDVLQHVTTNIRVTDITGFDEGADAFVGVDNPGGTFEFDRAHNFKRGDIIGLKNTSTQNDGFYTVEVVKPTSVNVLAGANNSIEDLTDINGYVSILRSVNFDTIKDANVVLEDKIVEDQKVWINGSSKNDWAVAIQENVYDDKKHYNNPSDYDITSTYEFGSAMSSNKANTRIVLGDHSANSLNGNVYTYQRGSNLRELLYEATLNLDTDTYPVADGHRFGADIDISSDGKYLIVGSSTASDVASNYRDTYSKTIEYAENDTVKYNENYWKAVRTITPESASIAFSTFDSYANFERSSDSSLLTLILQGSPYLPNTQTDHLLIAAPFDQYRGSKPQDKLVLNWNNYTNFNRNTGSTTPVEVFPQGINPQNTASQYTEPTSTFIEGEHVIVEKVDAVLLVEPFTDPPEEGDIIDTVGGSATVYKAFQRDFKLVMYIKDTNGVFGPTGTVTNSNGTLIGEYTQPNYNGTTGAAGGWWYINTGTNYLTSDEFTEAKDFGVPGYGLVYQDVLVYDENTQTYARTIPNFYANGLDDVQNTIFPTRDEPVFVSVLSHRGAAYINVDNDGVQNILDNRWLMRVPSALNGEITQAGDQFRAYINDQADAPDFTLLGIDPSYINDNLHTVVDMWEGYIDFTFTKTQGADVDMLSDQDIDTGDFFEPAYEGKVFSDLNGNIVNIGGAAGDFIRDEISGARGRVAYYIRRATDQGRVYLKDVTGTFTQGNRLLLETLEGPSQLPNQRIMGPINKISVTGNNTGKIAVMQKGTSFPAHPESYGGLDQFRDLNAFAHINKEFWVYKENLTEAGAEAEASIPSTANSDWRLVYNLPVDTSGSQVSKPANQGVYSIFNRVGSTWTNRGTWTIPGSTTNSNVGKQVAVTQDGDLYRFYVGSKENLTVIKHGTDKYGKNYNYALDINPHYRGPYTADVAYKTDEIVLYNNQLYSALTFVKGVVPTDSLKWTTLDSTVNYLPTLPNAVNIYNDPVFNDLGEGVLDFTQEISVSENGQVLAISVITDTSVDPDNKVLVYRILDDRYVFDQTIVAPVSNTGWGSSISLSEDGDTLVIADPESDVQGFNTGKVFVYAKVNGTFELHQTLSGTGTLSEKFGTKVSISKDIIAVTSGNGDIITETTFDDGTTSFDDTFTTYPDKRIDSGSVRLYQKIKDAFILAEELDYDGDDNVLVASRFGEQVLINDNHVYVGVPADPNTYYDEDINPGSFVDYQVTQNKKPWTLLRTPNEVVDIQKIKSTFLYDVKTNQLSTYLDYIDPVQGKIAGPAEQELTFKSNIDFARYNVTTLPDYFSETANWEEQHVGKLWWDLSTAKFFNVYQEDITNQANNWSKLIPNYTVDVYEWVESNIVPEDWDTQAETAAGFAKGISGFSKYGNDAYSQKLVYDPVSQTFSDKYYFWVKNKLTVPVMDSRKISASEVANLIADPRGQGYSFVALLSNDRFVLYNCESLIKDKDIALHVSYYTQDTQEQNRHFEYSLLTEGLETSVPKADIERKWIDSLLGYDSRGRIVPDPELSAKDKYGTLNSPRQSWFVNRQEAFKQVVERANLALRETIIVDDFSFTTLNSADVQPFVTDRTYDYKIDTLEELDFIGINKIKTAKLQASVHGGVVNDIRIIDTGRGYNDPTYDNTTSVVRHGPSFELFGNGSGLDFNLEINNLGQISKVNIINGGSGYDENLRIEVRPLTVLVENDSTVNNKWAIYEWNKSSSLWNRVKSQSYDTKEYWDYVDWYATGYTQFTRIDHRVDESYQLASANAKIGQIVKIDNIGNGGWLLLKRVADTNSLDYTIDYETIGRENGTIEISSKIYNVIENTVGYDLLGYDNRFFDTEPVTEGRQILTALKNDIFVDNLAIKWQELFLASVRYVLSEQQNVDWVYKTSFVKAKHNVGELDQKINYQNDNLSSYNDYINEVKPYKTNIREYLSSYENVDNTNTQTSDFDVPPYYDYTQNGIKTKSVKIRDNDLIGADAFFDEYPYQSWKENYGYKVTAINIYDGGSKYTYPPTVTIAGGGGTGATARAYIGAGKVIKIEVTNSGSGYTSAPTVTLSGSQADGSTTAIASAQIGDGVVRSLHVGIKFDRVSGQYFITTLPETETFTGTAINDKFDLKWPINLKRNKIKVTINGTLLLRSEYTFTNVDDKTYTYDRQKGQIAFSKTPELGDVILVEYEKDPAILNAQDRINHLYNPTTGMLGKDLAQLMVGVDYGGVEVKSFGFEGTSGWMTDEYGTDTWDSYDNTFEDEIFFADGTTVAIELAKPLEDGVEYNVYLKRFGQTKAIRIDDPSYNTVPTNPLAMMQTLVGDGVTQTINLAENDIQVNDGDIVTIRKTTSDGSFKPDGDSYDTILEGGALEYGNAGGINADDIILDGDLFVTPLTSGGPEELVNGQVMDSVNITVYERNGEGQGQIYNQNYLTDGTTTTYPLGLAPHSNDAVIVKLGNTIVDKAQYSLDYTALTVTFNNAPAEDQILTILTVGINGQNIIDLGVLFTIEGQSSYVTNLLWDDKYAVYLRKNGQEPDGPELIAKKSDTGFIEFVFSPVAPPAGTRLDYEIYADNTLINYSKIQKDNIIADGSSVTYNLSTNAIYETPAEFFSIVEVNGAIKKPGYSKVFHITEATKRTYTLETFQVQEATLSAADTEVYLNGKLLNQQGSYTVNIGESSITIASNLLSEGDILSVYFRNGDYRIVGNQLTFTDLPAEDDIINAYTFSNHDILDINRISYDVINRSALTPGSDNYSAYHQLTGGRVLLNQPASGVEYVWIFKNGSMLSPSVDYKLQDNMRIIELANEPSENDTIDIIHFTAPISTPTIAWQQFKDILNRTHYKRVDNNDGVRLAQDLEFNDLRIVVVEGADRLPTPDKRANKPGIIWINGERIEYFAKTGNDLRQLRRGTLGTGIATTHKIGTRVYGAGVEKNIPYADQNIVWSPVDAVTEGQTEFTLDFTPNSVNEFEVFAAGKRLNKAAIATFDPALAIDSPEGDVNTPAEFTVNGNTLTLTSPMKANQKLVVIRKVGKLWTDPGTPLKDAQNDIGSFLRGARSELPE